MASLPSFAAGLVTGSVLSQAVGSSIPLSSVSSVVQTLSNIQGFNPGSFSSLSGSISSALSGISELSSIVDSFSGTSALGAFSSMLSTTGLAGTSISQLAGEAATAFNAASSFLSGIPDISSFANLLTSISDVEIARDRASTNKGGYYQFPADIGKYWIAMSFMSYNYSASKNPINVKPAGSIILPVPINLTDSNHLEYSNFSMTQAALSGAAGAAEAIGSVAGGAGSGALAGIGKMLAAGGQAAGVLTGKAVNTNQSLMFVQPTLKEHTFRWKLVPSTEAEAAKIYQIINVIKHGIYPAASSYFFEYPNLVQVFLSNADKLYMFKPAFVTSFSVDYTPEGGPAFHKSRGSSGGYPVAVNINMSIKENSVWTSEEFTATGISAGSYATSSPIMGPLTNMISGAASGISSAVSNFVGGPGTSR